MNDNNKIWVLEWHQTETTVSPVAGPPPPRSSEQPHSGAEEDRTADWLLEWHQTDTTVSPVAGPPSVPLSQPHSGVAEGLTKNTMIAARKGTTDLIVNQSFSKNKIKRNKKHVNAAANQSKFYKTY